MRKINEFMMTPVTRKDVMLPVAIAIGLITASKITGKIKKEENKKKKLSRKDKRYVVVR